MKPMPDADEIRRLADIEHDKAARLPDGAKKASHLRKARDYEADAHSREWRDSSLHAPR